MDEGVGRDTDAVMQQSRGSIAMAVATAAMLATELAALLAQRGVDVARIRKLSVGSIDIRNRQVGVIDLDGLVHDRLLEAERPVAGLLGAEILDSHHGIIDFGTRTLYLRR